MTEEELDQIASAYLDGEANPQEVALVERDSGLRSRVENLRSVSTQLGSAITISPELKEQHLAAALAQFDSSQAFSSGSSAESSNTLSDAEPAGVDNVVDFNARSRETLPTIGDQHMTPVKSRSMPQWLSAAAVSLCVVGGGVWLASQMGSSSDTDAASLQVEAADSSFEESADESAALVASDDDAMEDSMEDFSEDDAVEESMDDAAGDGAMTESEASQPATTTPPTAPEPESEQAVDGDAASTGEATQSQGAGSGFFPDEPVASFGETPDAALLVQEPPATPRVDLEQSQCAYEIGLPVQLTGYLPIEVGGNPAEFFIFIDENGQESGIVLDGDCQTLQ